MLYELDGIRPEIDETAWIAPGSHLIGRVRMRADSSVWFGVTIRGDNEWIEIGRGSNVQENAVLHTDMGFPLTIGADCTIGHKAMLHGCTIGDNTLIGMGAMIMNGAVIGKNCLIGAGAMVTEGKVIPEGSMVVGTPGKVVRQLDAAWIERLAHSAESYRKHVRQCRASLKAL